jgi:hypothetical protein
VSAVLKGVDVFLPHRALTSAQQIANILPPPHDLDLPIVKLLTHPFYHSYQSHIATLSFFPRVYLSYAPPVWNAPTPPIPKDAAVTSKEKKEWKRRIKMYRELLGTSPFVSPFIRRLILSFLQWVPQLKRSGLNVLFLARRRLLFPEHCRMRAIGTRLRVRHSRSWALTRRALMLCLEAMHDVSMRLGRMEVPESAY